MKIERILKEEIDLGGTLILKDVKVCGKKYTLKIWTNDKINSFYIDFYKPGKEKEESDPDYTILIVNKSIGFMRLRKKDKKVEEIYVSSSKEIIWRDLNSARKEGYKEPLLIPFGSNKD